MSGFRFGCGKQFTTYVPSGYSCREITVRCGSTSYTGGVNQCDDCADRPENQVVEPHEGEGDMEWFERNALSREREDDNDDRYDVTPPGG